MNSLINKNSLVVSCQALAHEPLHGSQHMSVMALAAREGGAKGIRANSPEDVRAIRAAVELPIIGLWKNDYEGYEMYITPTIQDAVQVYEAGAHIVAIDATARPRPDGFDLKYVIEELNRQGIPVMADISTYEEGMHAAECGASYISTTLAGYTTYSQGALPRLDLVKQLSEKLSVPVVAEGGISTPDQAMRALENGAYFVVVGSAITRPQLITAQYVLAMAEYHL